MAVQIQLRRGTTAEHATFTGVVGEVTVDTTKDTLVVHDGSTVGGFPVATESGLNLKANIADLTTANVSELNNLYYTDARVYSNVTQLGYATTNDLTTANVAEVDNLYYTDARVYSNVTQLGYATVTYVNNEVANLVASAPAALDTLNELAAALGNDNNFATTTVTLIGNAYDTANTALTTASAAFDAANTKATLASSIALAIALG